MYHTGGHLLSLCTEIFTIYANEWIVYPLKLKMNLLIANGNNFDSKTEHSFCFNQLNKLSCRANSKKLTLLNK